MTASLQSAERSRRLAALDVGSNSIRLIVVEVLPDGKYRLLDDEREVTRLGSGIAKTGKLSQRSMLDSALAIERMKIIAEGYGVKRLAAVATSAVREAQNRQVFLRMVRKQAGIDLSVISAEEEARLAHKSVARAFDLRTVNAAIVDIGGGSTEVVVTRCGAVENVHTLRLGAVRLTDLFGSELSDSDYKRMRNTIKRQLKERVEPTKSAPQLVIGTGGTFTTLAAIAIARESASVEQSSATPTIRGFELQRAELKHILDRLRSMSVKARAKVPGLSLERADIIVAGVAIIDCIMKRLGVNTLRVHDRGIRDGLILNMIDREFPKLAVKNEPCNRISSARQFAETCHYERAHSEHVAKLALNIFDQMAEIRPQLGLWTAEHREILEAASILHDIGYYINYAKHHKHSHHLIVHSELAGFSYRELNVIGNIARYHRRAEPKKSHPPFTALCADDQRSVRALTAILRVADGLDRTHSQSVEGVTLRCGKKKIAFCARAKCEPTVDMWGAAKKCGLFENFYKLTPTFEWVAKETAKDATALKPLSLAS